MTIPFEILPGDDSPLGRARLALEGLSVGDAYLTRHAVEVGLGRRLP